MDLEKYKAARHTITPLYNEMQKKGKIKNVREDVLIFDNIIDGFYTLIQPEWSNAIPLTLLILPKPR